jgi:hypothetical protein
MCVTGLSSWCRIARLPLDWTSALVDEPSPLDEGRGGDRDGAVADATSPQSITQPLAGFRREVASRQDQHSVADNYCVRR